MLPRLRQIRLGSVGLLVLLGTLRAFALDPALPPGSNFDLSHWKITLPDTNATEKTAAQLTAGYTNALYFFTSPDGAMTFICPVDGGTTGGSSYPRSELRELLNPADDNVNWSSGTGTHTLDGQCRVTRVPSSGKVIIGQIHGFSGAANPMIKLQFQNGSIDALYKKDPAVSTDTHLVFSNPGLSNLITYRIQTAGTNLNITVNGTTLVGDIKLWTNEFCYFKAGNYCQDNTGTNGEGASVSFYAVGVTHVTNTGVLPVITNQPVGVTNLVGSNAVFSVTAGPAPLTYRWRFGGTNLVGTNLLNATNASLTLTNLQLTNAGNYTVVVSNAAGAVTSSVALLAVHAPPVIITLPPSQTVTPGSNVTLTLAATGTPAPVFRWRTNATLFAAQTNPTFTLTNFQATNGLRCDVIVTNAAGAVTSAVVMLYPDTPFRLTNALTLGPSNSTFTLLGKQGSNYIFQSSSDFTNWTSLLTNSSPTGILTFTNAGPQTNGRRYYRVKVP